MSISESKIKDEEAGQYYVRKCLKKREIERERKTFTKFTTGETFNKLS